MNKLNKKIWERVNELLAADKAPDDILEQLDKLRKKLPKSERVHFDDFYEAAIVKFDIVDPE